MAGEARRPRAGPPGETLAQLHVRTAQATADLDPRGGRSAGDRQGAARHQRLPAATAPTRSDCLARADRLGDCAVVTAAGEAVHRRHPRRAGRRLARRHRGRGPQPGPVPGRADLPPGDRRRPSSGRTPTTSPARSSTSSARRSGRSSPRPGSGEGQRPSLSRPFRYAPRSWRARHELGLAVLGVLELGHHGLPAADRAVPLRQRRVGPRREQAVRVEQGVEVTQPGGLDGRGLQDLVGDGVPLLEPGCVPVGEAVAAAAAPGGRARRGRSPARGRRG